ncbi:hypothetical protein [Sphingomonas sp. NFX23]|uniref:hypothetical protein n=1 Tax=Sphingomonas sp. NFX23 TaxID=2819532 RepID=UPI003CF3C986
MIDFDLFGHQIPAHLKPDCRSGPALANPVDGRDVPVPHFGVILTMPVSQILAARFESASIAFVIKPYIRFKGSLDVRR